MSLNAYNLVFTAEDFSSSSTSLHVSSTMERTEVTPGRLEWLDTAAERAEEAFRQIAEEGGEPDTSITREVVQRLFERLPPTLPPVETYVSPLGSICFDWDDHPTNTLSIMIKAGGQMAAAAYFDGDQFIHTCDIGARLPFEIDRLVERWLMRERLLCEVNR